MADKSGYIGRAPGDSSVIIASQTFEPSGVQTNFTFASGYDPGYVEAYLNGVKLIYAVDFVATNGSTVGLTSFANNGDVLEVVAYKAFNLGNPVTEATGNFSVGNQLTIVGLTTGAQAFFSGVVTATSFSGDGSSLTGVSGGKFSSNDTGIHTTSSVGIGTTNATGAADSNNTAILNVGVVTTNSVVVGSSVIVGSAVTVNSTGIDAISGIITANKFVGNGSLLTNVGVSTEFVTADQLTVTGVTTSSSVIVGSAVTINSTGIDAVSGVITASSFVGNATGNASGTSGGLSGTPDITVRNVTGVAATFTGVLTYEDVTNVDSIGIVTARGGLEVGAAGVGGTISSGGNVIFAGITTVGTALSLADNIKASFGNSNDLQIYHDASNAFIANNGSGDFYIQGGNVKIRNVAGSANLAQFVQSGKVGLFFNGSEKFETTNEGTVTTGVSTSTAISAAVSLWVVGNNGSNHFTFTGPGNLSATDDPTIQLQRGQKYVFRNIASGHPFRIQSTINGSTGTQYNTGVTNNDGGAGTDIIFDVPFNAPNILYYQCTNHANMGGVLLIGERSIPILTKTSSYTVVADDAGKTIYTDSNVEFPNSVFNPGDAISVVNNSGGNITLTQGSGVTLYNANGGATGSLTLAGRGIATILYVTTSIAYGSGAGVS